AVALEHLLGAAPVRGDRREGVHGPTRDELVEPRPEGLRDERVDKDDLLAEVDRDAPDELRPVAHALGSRSAFPRRMPGRPAIEAGPQLLHVEVRIASRRSWKARLRHLTRTAGRSGSRDGASPRERSR